MDFTPRPDCPTCGGSGTIAIDPDRPAWPGNEAPCLSCCFGTHDRCRIHGFTTPCVLCTLAAMALAEGRAQPFEIVPLLPW